MGNSCGSTVKVIQNKRVLRAADQVLQNESSQLRAEITSKNFVEKSFGENEKGFGVDESSAMVKCEMSEEFRRNGKGFGENESSLGLELEMR
ncbi:hypothetical protein RYX36_002618 [Vicia faba]